MTFFIGYVICLKLLDEFFFNFILSMQISITENKEAAKAFICFLLINKFG